MSKLGHSGKLAKQIVQFAFHHRAYWILPLIILLAVAAVLSVSIESATPLLYTLF